MSVRYQDEQVVVVDDLLSPEQFQAVWSHHLGQTFTSVHARHLDSRFALDDGTPLVGEIGAYPTKTAVDPLLEAVRARLGQEGRVDARSFVLRQNTGMSWHHGGPHAASFVYYVHPTWDVLWGGELLLADASTRCTDAELADTHHRFDNRKDNEALLRVGIGRFVMPKPNRLVVVGRGYRYAIAKITPAAGNHPWSAITGTFSAPTA